MEKLYLYIFFCIAAFLRHSNKQPLFQERTGYHPSVWASFVHGVVPEIKDEVACASVCLMHEGPCHLFYRDAATEECYVGRFDYHSGGVLTETNQPFFMLANKYRQWKIFLSF